MHVYNNVVLEKKKLFWKKYKNQITGKCLSSKLNFKFKILLHIIQRRDLKE